MIKIKNDTRHILAQNITYFRHKNNWSQETLAEKMLTSPAYISQLENAKRNVSIDYIARLSQTFNIEAEELFKIRNINKKKHINSKN